MNQLKTQEELEETSDEIESAEDEEVPGDNYPVTPMPYHYKDKKIYELRG